LVGRVINAVMAI